MSTATQGRRGEYRVRDRLAADGWLLVARSAASKGAADLIMVHPDHGLALIQAGTPNKTLGPADRERLCNMADLCNALPLLAVVVPRKSIRFFQVTRDVPSKWEEWAA